MDRERFDALARLLATTGSRRAALGALLGAGVMGTGLDAEAKKRSGKSRGGGGKGKDKDRNKKRRNRAQAEQLPGNCCSTSNCTPGKGKNLKKCCYEDAILTNRNFSGANLDQANFTDAEADGANFLGANLGKACLVDTNLTDAKINDTTTLDGAIFCRTTMPDGLENNSGCFNGTRCCHTCEEDAQCGAGAVCCNGNCRIGDCCADEDCENPDAPNCINNTCSACTGNNQCVGDERCCGPLCTDVDIDEANCGACGRECDEGATCLRGECVFVVSPGNLRGWRFIRETPTPEMVIPPQFETGPGNPPFGNGSAFLTVNEDAGPPEVREGELLAANIFEGTPLANLQILEYTVHVTSSTSNSAPSLQLGIDFNPADADGFQGRMVYVPGEGGPFPQGQWITIDALDDSAGEKWFFTRQNAPPGGSGGACPQNNKCSFQQILNQFPNIRIHPVGAIGAGAGFGFMGFKVGSGEGDVDANVDSIRIKLEGANQPVVVYTFEENP